MIIQIILGLAFMFCWGAVSGICCILDQINIPRGGHYLESSRAMMMLCLVAFLALTVARFLLER
jgi:hypothetical protein